MAPCFIVLFQVLELLSLQRFLIEHVRVEERADILIVALKTFQDEEGRNDKENLGLPALELFREFLMLFARGFDD